jgi:hypothetical protein
MKELWKVTFDEEAGSVVVRVAGKAAHADHEAAREEAVRLCREKKCPRLLVDLRDLTTTRSSTLDCYSFGESLAKTQPSLRIAHVLPTDARSANDVRFTSNVAANRGKLTGEFNSIEEARQWLLQNNNIKA